MYSLILKDLLIQKKMISLSWIYIVFFLFTLQGAGFIVYPTVLAVITYMLVATSCALDEKNKADIMLNSLPLKRSNIVMAKYLSIFVYIAISTAAYFIVTNVISLTGLPVKIHPISPEGLAGGLLSISLINGIYFPFYFKFGYIKSRFLSLILFFTFYFGLTTALNLLAENREVAWIENVISFFESRTDMQMFTIVIGLTVFMLTVSYTLSLKAYKGRDF